jgi:hypothetical protein
MFKVVERDTTLGAITPREYSAVKSLVRYPFGTTALAPLSTQMSSMNSK